MSMTVYHEADVDTAALKGQTLAVIGFGSQGHAHALNLKESGHEVLIGLYEGSQSIPVAQEFGFEVVSNAEAVRRADVIMLGVPDMKQKAVYEADIAPHLTPGKALLFSHGFAVHYGLIQAPEGVDVIMVAPKGPGQIVRRTFTEGKGVPALIAVAQDATGTAKARALGWAHGVGGTRAGVLETSFKEETETDLFGEQAVLCGGASALIMAGFETLVEAGYAPEMAYFECCHELKLIVDLIVESGISGMRFTISETAKYGDVSRGPRVITDETKAAMKQILTEIQDGSFAREWVSEYQAGLPKYNSLLQAGESHPIEETGERLRSMMPWVKKRAIKGAQAAYSK